MQLQKIVRALELQVKSGGSHLDREVGGGYASDLLSDVMAHAKKGDIWVTLQIHANIVGVATLTELAGIVIVNGREPEKDTLEKAEAEKVPIMVTGLSAFEVVGKLHGLLGAG